MARHDAPYARNDGANLIGEPRLTAALGAVRFTLHVHLDNRPGSLLPSPRRSQKRAA
jgi:hypothetical protein